MKVNDKNMLVMTNEEINFILEYITGISTGEYSNETEYLDLKIPFTKRGMDGIRKFVKEKSVDETTPEVQSDVIKHIMTNILTTAYTYMFDYSLSSFLSVKGKDEEAKAKAVERMQFVIENLNAFKYITENAVDQINPETIKSLN